MLALALRVVLFILAYIAGRLFLENTAPFSDMLSEVLVRWDARHYVHLAEHGYSNVGDERFLLVFMPLFPAAVFLVRLLVQDTLVAGLLVSFAASIAAGYFIQKLARLDGNDAFASRAVVFISLFPTAFFLFLPYTEAFFLALSLASFYYARQSHWRYAGLFGMLAAATRLQGILLLPALMVEAWHQREHPVRAAGLLLIPLGLLAYLGLNAYVAGDALAFIDYQREHWFHEFITPWDAILHAVNDVLHNPPSLNRFITSESLLASVLFCGGLLVWARSWLRPSYQAYGWLMLAALLSVSFQISMPRYVLSLFPIFLVLAHGTHNRSIYLAWAAASGLFMGGLFFLYTTGHWAF